MYKNKIAFAVVGVLALAGCNGGGSETGEAVEAPVIKIETAKPSVNTEVPISSSDGSVVFQNIAVHDPSIVEDDGTYYIFGSHLAAAKSTDLLSWQYISSLSSNNLVNESPLFDTYTAEIAEGIDWTDGFTGNWAANVIKAPNGKFWFYYNHCGQDNPDTTDVVDEVCWNRSYLGLAEADNIEGPYTDKGVFLRSGYRTDAEFVEFPLDNDQTTYNPAVDPNTIDPAAFYDADDNLWMVYGSYSGGIFVLAMDEATGKPEAGQGYGTHLVGGNFRAMEGAFAFYSPESDYYYLMYSVAGFAADDGYNIRVARSKTPNGPYLDPAGVDISTITDSLEVGAKLMGGFEYTQEIGETAASWGYQAPGHNSAYFDQATGRHLLVTHTRFPQTSSEFPTIPEAHQVRVHEMFINKDGWLVSSPQRYVPLEGDNVVAKDDVYGYYKFINHGSEVNTKAIRSGNIALNTDMTVTGSETGVWYMLDPENIKLELSSGTYVGVLKYQWDDSRSEIVPTFSGVSTDGASIWGSYVDPITATQAALQDTYDNLTIKTELSITDEGYALPLLGKHSANISWQSSDEYYIGNDGSVFIPTSDRGNKTLTLTANIALNGQTIAKNFTVNLEARPTFRNAVAHYTFDDSLTDSLGGFSDATATTAIFGDVTDAAYIAGQTGQALNLDGSYGVLLPSNVINSYQYTVSFWLNQQQSFNFRPALFSAHSGDRWQSFLPSSWDSQLMLWSHWLEEDGSFPWFDGPTGVAYPLAQWHHVAYTVNAGLVKIYYDGQLVGTATGLEDLHTNKPEGSVIALGLNFWDAPLVAQIDEFIIYDYALDAANILAAAYNNVTDPADFEEYVLEGVDLGDVSAVKADFELPRVGAFSSGVTWTSSDTTGINPVNGQAIVTQPAPAEGDKAVTLTATISFLGETYIKEFAATVKSLAPAEYSFEGDLSAKDGVAQDGTVTGGLIGSSGGTVSYTTGVVGQALLLDGTSGVRLPNNLVTSQQYSISVWLKPTVMTDYTTALFGASDTSNWLSLVPQHNNTDIGPLNSSTLWAATGGAWWNEFNFGEPVFSTQGWTHLVITVDASTAKVYLNGVINMESTEFPNLFALGLPTEWGIGVNYWDTPYKGAVDELKFFYETIDAEKVTELYSESAQ